MRPGVEARSVAFEAREAEVARRQRGKPVVHLAKA
jgi:hypothetical protein